MPNKIQRPITVTAWRRSRAAKDASCRLLALGAVLDGALREDGRRLLVWMLGRRLCRTTSLPNLEGREAGSHMSARRKAHKREAEAIDAFIRDRLAAGTPGRVWFQDEMRGRAEEQAHLSFGQDPAHVPGAQP
jgi:hypothetical protein